MSKQKIPVNSLAAYQQNRFYETYYATWNNRRRGGAFGSTLAVSRGVFANTLQPVKPETGKANLMVDSKTKL